MNPLSARTIAACIPPGPPPTTATGLPSPSFLTSPSIYSLPMRGLTAHASELRCTRRRSLQTIHPMHVRISSALPSFAFFMNIGSANCDLPSPTKSDTPSSRSCSANSGDLIVFVAMIGMLSCSLKAFATCFFHPGVYEYESQFALPFRPLPLLTSRTSMPFPSRCLPIARPSFRSSVSGMSGVNSSPHIRTEIGKFGPSVSRILSIISSIKRIRFSRLPPYSSVRLL